MSEVVKGNLSDFADIIVAQLQSGFTITLVVRGTSMFPLFIDGKTEVTLGKAQSYKKGDIIFYTRANGSYVLHRIISQQSDSSFTLCGDNQTALERGVQLSSILGKVQSYKLKNKVHKVSGIKFRMYSFWWRAFLPIRGLILKVLRRIKPSK